MMKGKVPDDYRGRYTLNRKYFNVENDVIQRRRCVGSMEFYWY